MAPGRTRNASSCSTLSSHCLQRCGAAPVPGPATATSVHPHPCAASGLARGRGLWCYLEHILGSCARTWLHIWLSSCLGCWSWARLQWMLYEHEHCSFTCGICTGMAVHQVLPSFLGLSLRWMKQKRLSFSWVCLLMVSLSSSSSISVPAPDCLLWHTPEPEAGEHPLSAPQANVRSCRVASGFLRYLPSSCRKALTFGSKWAPSYLTSFSLTGYLIPSNRSIFPLASCKSRPWLEDFQCAVYPVLVENTSHVAPSSW